LLNNGTKKDIVSIVITACNDCQLEWLKLLSEKLVKELLRKYLICWVGEKDFPFIPPEPTSWNPKVCESVKKFLEVYSFLAIGSKSLKINSIKPSLESGHHALLCGLNVHFIWGGQIKTGTGMIIQFYFELEKMRFIKKDKKILLVMVESKTPVVKEDVELVIKKARQEYTKANENHVADSRFHQGDVTTEEVVDVDLKLLFETELTRNIDVSKNSGDLENKLQKIIEECIV
jgi:hypothetical protein